MIKTVSVIMIPMISRSCSKGDGWLKCFTEIWKETILIILSRIDDTSFSIFIPSV